LSVHGVLLGAFVAGLGLSITLAESALALLTLLWLWRLCDPAVRAAARWPLAAPVLAFSAVTVLSALLSGHPLASLEAAKGLLLAAALYVTADALREPGAADRFLFGLALAATVAAVVGLLQVGLCPPGDAPLVRPRWLYHRCDRAHGFFSIYMTLAAVLSLVLLATLPRLLSPGAARRLLGIPWLVMMWGLIVTYTRGAWIGFAGGVLTVAATVRRGRWVLVGGLVVLAASALLAPYELRHRFLSMADPEEAGVRERIYMWKSGLAMWRERPILGVGPGGVKRDYVRYAREEAVKKRTGHVHNTPLQILVERGVLGLAAWLWLWLAFYGNAIRRLRRLSPDAVAERALVVGAIAAITGFLIGGLSEYNFGDSEVVMVAWVIMALPWAVDQSQRKPERVSAEP
jgi:O-antigen ligase